MTKQTIPFPRSSSLLLILGMFIILSSTALSFSDVPGRRDIRDARDKLNSIDPNDSSTPVIEPEVGLPVTVEFGPGSVTILVDGSIDVLLLPGEIVVFTDGAIVTIPATVATMKILGIVTTTFSVNAAGEIIKLVDLDGDGIMDEGYIDTDGDGDADFFFANLGDNTRPDGSPDWDSASFDSNNDGFYDTTWGDANDNGNVEPTEIGSGGAVPVLPMTC